jgi:endonuclease/exonuclease/phosphatase family metal-dependent hydrolase
MASGARIRVLSWNIFHGRDNPPNPDLFTWRSRLLRVVERDATHKQVNRPLQADFAELLAALEWDVAFLQEAPPHWLSPLSRHVAASGAASALTARNSLAPLRRWLAEGNPDLVGAHEDGSNQVLVRPPWSIAELRRLTIARSPERRRMLWLRLCGRERARLAVANVHLTSWNSPEAGREAIHAAERAVTWAGEDPLVFGGDLNAPDTYRALRQRFGLIPEPPPMTIEHMLIRGLEVLDPPRSLPPESRELREEDGRLLRLSDHALDALPESTRDPSWTLATSVFPGRG